MLHCATPGNKYLLSTYRLYINLPCIFQIVLEILLNNGFGVSNSGFGDSIIEVCVIVVFSNRAEWI